MNTVIESMTVFAGFMEFLRDSSKAVVHQPDTSTAGPASPEPVESTSVTGATPPRPPNILVTSPK